MVQSDPAMGPPQEAVCGSPTEYRREKSSKPSLLKYRTRSNRSFQPADREILHFRNPSMEFTVIPGFESLAISSRRITCRHVSPRFSRLVRRRRRLDYNPRRHSFSLEMKVFRCLVLACSFRVTWISFIRKSPWRLWNCSNGWDATFIFRLLKPVAASQWQTRAVRTTPGRWLKNFFPSSANMNTSSVRREVVRRW